MTAPGQRQPLWLRYLALCKPGLCLLVASAALAGYLWASPRWSGGFVPVWAGVLVLAAGAAALNQYQDRRVDARMDRTKRRPLPSGGITPGRALGFSFLLIASGLAILGLGGCLPVILGALAAGWYNAVYTPLKKVTALAAVPGALSGALAPAIGWTFAGGRPDDPRIAVLALLLFVWQIPHFWLVAIGRADEYRAAGMPTVLDVLSETQARRIVAHWVLATAVGSVIIAGWGSLQLPLTRWGVLAASLWLAGRALGFRSSGVRQEALLFRTMNLHMLAVLGLICLDSLLRHAGL
jgi:protoheme IX farnesyltransferase